MTKTVLFAWELGLGLGHLMNMHRIARRLARHDCRTILASSKVTAALALQGPFDEIIQAPKWPLDTLPEERRLILSSATLNDILSGAGLADRIAVEGLLRSWLEIFKSQRPALVIADFAPLAAFAAKGRIPLALIGSGYTLPPAELPRFPPLHRRSPPIWKEKETLDAVNAAASKLNLTPLDRLPQIFSGDAGFVQTFALLDPYDTQRVEAVSGPLIDRVPEVRQEGATSIFAYLSGGYEPHPSIFEALRPFAQHLRVHAPRLPASALEELSRAGARIDAEAVPLAEILPSTRLILHHGGSGAAAEALVSGVPQLILSAQVEQDLNGEALQRAGVARLVRTYEPETKLSRELVEDIRADRAMTLRAAKLGSWHRQELATMDPLSTCERECLRLMGR